MSEDLTREQILEQLVRDYDTLLSSIMVRTPMRGEYIKRADALHEQVRTLGILDAENTKASTE